MKAIQYSNRVASLIQELEDLYNQAGRLCQGLDLNLVGKRWLKIPLYPLGYDENEWRYEERMSTFSEQMQIISIYLKCLGGEYPNEVLSEQEYQMFLNADLEDRLLWFFIASYIESLISWLNDAIDQCDNMLQIKYQPGGELFQQAQDRNVGRYGIQK